MRIALLYTTSELTPWKENVNINTLLFIQKNLPAEIFSEILIFEGFTEKMFERLLKFDLIFNLCYGFGQADQTDVALWLEKNGIKHSASNAKAMLLAQNKALLPHICEQSGLFTPEIITELNYLEGERMYIAKPRTGACHRDILIGKGSWFQDKSYLLLNDFILQPYIFGREFSVAVIPSLKPLTYDILPPVEIVQEECSEIYIAGQQYGKTKRVFNPVLTEKQYNSLTHAALTLHNAIGLKGMSRTDFRLDNSGKIYALDVNAMPNMDPKLSLMPAICDYHGIEMQDLLQRVVNTTSQSAS